METVLVLNSHVSIMTGTINYTNKKDPFEIIITRQSWVFFFVVVNFELFQEETRRKQYFIV